MSNPSTQIASAAIQFGNKLEAVIDQVIAELPNLLYEELIEVERQWANIGRGSWRVICAVHAEILNRQPAYRGRLKDEDGRGVDAAVRKHAAERGIHPQTIYQNAAIHKTFFASSGATRNKDQYGVLDELEDREFFRAALCSDDAWGTIERFAQEKLKNPFFSTRDAWRMVKEGKTPPLDETVPALCDQPEVVEAWQQFQESCRKLMTLAPRLQGLVGGYLEEVKYELTIPSQTVKEAIFELIRQGWDEVDQIALRMRKDRIHVTVWLNRLVELGDAESFEKERAPGARGAARTGYREI